MKKLQILKFFLLLILLYSSSANAGFFIALASGQTKIDTPSASTSPSLNDFRLGYEDSYHQFELAIMTSSSDDQLNQLTVDIPSVKSVFYRYISDSESDVKFHLILGASQIEVESTYPGIPDSIDRFNGFSYGIGIEEALRSIPNLKIKIDWITLYDGDQIKITATNLGLRYEF